MTLNNPFTCSAIIVISGLFSAIRPTTLSASHALAYILLTANTRGELSEPTTTRTLSDSSKHNMAPLYSAQGSDTFESLNLLFSHIPAATVMMLVSRLIRIAPQPFSHESVTRTSVGSSATLSLVTTGTSLGVLRTNHTLHSCNA